MSELTREEWLARRRSGIGGSDVAAVLGLHLAAPRDVAILRTELVDERQNGGVQ